MPSASLTIMVAESLSKPREPAGILGVAAVLIAWTTVAGKAWLAARAEPATALRHD